MSYSTAQLLEFIAEIAPNRYMQSLLIISLFFVLAKIVDLVLTKFVRRALKKNRFTLDEKLLDIFHRPIFLSIILFGLSLAADRLSFPENIYFVTTSLLKTLAILLWSKAAYRFLSLVIEIISHDDSRFTLIQERTKPLFVNLTMILVFALAIYFVFLAWEINLTAWVASAGIIGLAISFAAKDTLANLFAGVFILADAPYKLKDMVVLDSGERGEITGIGIRSTRILTRDDVEITIPNSIMGNAKIINETAGPHELYRIRIKVGVAYGSDIDKVHAVLKDVAVNHPIVSKYPEPRVRFRSFGDSSLDHELLCWVAQPVLKGKAVHELNTAVYKRFIAEGIEIPFPQRDLHITSTATQTVLEEKDMAIAN